MKHYRTIRTLQALVLVVLCAGLPGAGVVQAGSSAVNTGHFNNLAVGGYDVMTYWRGGDPKPGNPEIAADYNGATWVFVSNENRRAFLASPGAYAPQYGGYCAYAAALGYVADVDVRSWRIYRDRLYLNYNDRIRRRWASEIDDYIKKADARWPAPLGN